MDHRVIYGAILLGFILSYSWAFQLGNRGYGYTGYGGYYHRGPSFWYFGGPRYIYPGGRSVRAGSGGTSSRRHSGGGFSGGK
jgi:hypothetical protein